MGLDGRPGGNFTQPVDDLATGQIRFDVYVHWQRVASYTDSADAVAALHALLAGEHQTVELHPNGTHA